MRHYGYTAICLLFFFFYHLAFFLLHLSVECGLLPSLYASLCLPPQAISLCQVTLYHVRSLLCPRHSCPLYIHLLFHGSRDEIRLRLYPSVDQSIISTRPLSTSSSSPLSSNDLCSSSFPRLHDTNSKSVCHTLSFCPV